MEHKGGQAASGLRWSSLTVIAVLIAILIAAPVLSVFWATVLSFLTSFLHRKCALLPRDLFSNPQGVGRTFMGSGLVRALEGGSIGMLNVGTTCAGAGLIVGVVTLTGLGLKFSSIILTYAGGSLLLTAIYTGLIVWIIGLAVPVTASYIISAVIAAPALIKLGVPDYAAHMFIFYYAVLSEVSPPTALSPFAAAAITGGDPYRTTLQSWKYTMPAFLVTIRCTHRVGLLLTGLLLVTLALPFITYAPNRLLSGEGRGLWQVMPWLAGVQLAAALAGMLLCWLPGRIVPFLHLLLAELLFPLLIWGSGQAALELSRHGSPLARTSPGSGLWLSLALCLLLASEAIRHLTVRPLWRWLLNAQVWLLPIILLAIGALDQLSLLKEYANRQEVFDDALRQHLLLLFGTLLPGLLIGLPLGVWLWRRPRWQAPAFTALNVIQTIPSVALFGLLIAPLAGLARYFPTLGELGVSGTGVAPALIALTLYALLPLVRGVVTGLQQVPQDALESATAMGMSAGQRFRQVQLPLAMPVLLRSLRVVSVQTVGMAVVAALIGAGGFGALVFQGLLSSALDLVLLGVVPTIALAVVVDALFALWGAWLKGEAND